MEDRDYNDDLITWVQVRISEEMKKYLLKRPEGYSKYIRELIKSDPNYQRHIYKPVKKQQEAAQ